MQSFIVKGTLTIPNYSRWLVLFIQEKEFNNYNSTIQYISDCLNKDGISTLIPDFYCSIKENDNSLSKTKINAELLAQRVTLLADWLIDQEHTKDMLIGYFGIGKGATSALIAGNQRPNNVSVIVCLGRIPKLDFNHSFKNIKCPILIIAEEKDAQVMELNKQYLEKLLPDVEKKKLIILSDVNYLFEESKKLLEIAKKASGWYRCYFQIKEHSKKKD